MTTATKVHDDLENSVMWASGQSSPVTSHLEFLGHFPLIPLVGDPIVADLYSVLRTEFR